MDAATMAEAGEPIRTLRPSWRERWFHGLGWAGFAIVAIAALINAARPTIKIVVMEPVNVWLMYFLWNYAYNVTIGVTILLAVVWARNRVPGRGIRQYTIVFLAVAIAAAASLLFVEAWETKGTFGSDDPTWTLGHAALGLGSDWVHFLLLGLIIAGAWLYVLAEADHVAALEQCAVDSARMDQQTAEAQLQVLEAQIEPHFLFNTLANVKRLYDTDRASGARMLRNLKEYLAVALPQMRETRSTLGREVAHATAYLNIQQVRMGRRLAFAVEMPERLRTVPMPPLMLLTLVENAIKHGVGPSPNGGRIDLRASIDDDRLLVEVADTGLGFTKSAGGGTGLANLRARLAGHFGGAASLSLALNSPRGLIATIVLPYKDAAANRGSA